MPLEVFQKYSFQNKVNYLAQKLFTASPEMTGDICEKYSIKLTKAGQINRRPYLGRALQEKLDMMWESKNENDGEEIDTLSMEDE